MNNQTNEFLNLMKTSIAQLIIEKDQFKLLEKGFVVTNELEEEKTKLLKLSENKYFLDITKNYIEGTVSIIQFAKSLEKVKDYLKLENIDEEFLNEIFLNESYQGYDIFVEMKPNKQFPLISALFLKNVENTLFGNKLGKLEIKLASMENKKLELENAIDLYKEFKRDSSELQSILDETTVEIDDFKKKNENNINKEKSLKISFEKYIEEKGLKDVFNSLEKEIITKGSKFKK